MRDTHLFHPFFFVGTRRKLYELDQLSRVSKMTRAKLSYFLDA